MSSGAKSDFEENVVESGVGKTLPNKEKEILVTNPLEQRRMDILASYIRRELEQDQRLTESLRKHEKRVSESMMEAKGGRSKQSSQKKKVTYEGDYDFESMERLEDGEVEEDEEGEEDEVDEEDEEEEDVEEEEEDVYVTPVKRTPRSSYPPPAPRKRTTGALVDRVPMKRRPVQRSSPSYGKRVPSRSTSHVASPMIPQVQPIPQVFTWLHK